MLHIPPERLAPETLEQLIEAFIVREGTDYGQHELGLAEKVARLRRQIHQGSVVITYDPETESCNLMTAQAFRQLEDTAGHSERGRPEF